MVSTVMLAIEDKDSGSHWLTGNPTLRVNTVGLLFSALWGIGSLSPDNIICMTAKGKFAVWARADKTIAT
jgi:hypothetical protein